MWVQTMNINNHRVSNLPRRQRGMATVLIALFIGLAVTAAALSILHAINSTQDRQVGSHAQTHAQSAVWTGAEALGQYLALKGPAYLATLTTAAAPLTITGVGDTGDTLTAKVESVGILLDGSIEMTYALTAIDQSAQASSGLNLVYEVTGGGPPPVPDSGGMNLNDEVMLDGASTYKGDGEYTVKGATTGTGPPGTPAASPA